MGDVEPLSDSLILNGIDATTGRLAAAVSVATVARAARGLPPDPDLEARRAASSFGLEFLSGVRFDQLDQTGWGVIFAQDSPPELLEALKPLLALRLEQAGSRFHVFAGESGYKANERALAFLVRQGEAPGARDPDVFPYYLLLVGGPESIPFEFQYGLDLQHFVGRIAFATPAEYARYAATVVRAERGDLRRPRSMALFGPRHPGDPATQLSSSRLIAPLSDHVAEGGVFGPVTTKMSGEATKAALSALFAGAPGVLFTASHGISFPSGHDSQRTRQGALLCQDWAPTTSGPLAADVFFGAADVGDDVDVAGMMALHFACYGAGTPRQDNFAPYIGGTPTLAPAPFIAALPQRLLAHPRGSALAVIGHVDRAWGYSFAWPGIKDDTKTFANFFKELGDGMPVGYAMQSFNDRYVSLSGNLNELLQTAQGGSPAPDQEVAGAWVSSNDARNYVLLGDPAARLPKQPS